MRRILLGLVVVSAVTVGACISDEPAGSSTSSSSGSSACGVPDKGPGGCAIDEDYCFPGTAAKSCYSKGSAECRVTQQFACAAKAGCGSEPCCFNGKVTAVQGQVCALQLSALDTQCNVVNPSTTRPCVEVNGKKHGILCESDADCTGYGTGKCVRGLVEAPVNKVLAVCDDYD